MNVTILGAAGFLGRKLAERIARDGVVGGKPVKRLTLFDLDAPSPPVEMPQRHTGIPVDSIGGDLASLPANVIPEGTEVVFHLAAVVSAAAEADYDLGRRVNVRGTDAVIDACRALARPPRLVFTSSIASFSGGQRAVLADDARQIPGNSYGAQKAIGELLLADASRRGFLDAVCLRLPTIVVRPGRPNKAASSFVSGIVREPLLGLQTELPVSDDFAVWAASPRRAVEWLLHAGAMETAAMGLDRSVNPPGMSVTVAKLLAALEAERPGASALVKRVASPEIERIVSAWPAAFDPVRARGLGFAPHEPIEAVVHAFVEDDLDATRRERGL
jgi:D-erythronate 2-dehydrogenase